jgi:hypothetical protein
MDYKKHYDLLIGRASNRTIAGHKERHHIVPRCLGGSDKISNLVNLTAEEHFVAHQLLIKIYPGESKLVFALHRMTGGTNRNNKLFGWIRRQHAKEMSTLNAGKISNRKGKNLSLETKFLVKINNPKRKAVRTPYGDFYSAEEFSEKTNLLTANGFRILLRDIDVPITAHRARRSPILTLSNVGKTFRELGYSYIQDTEIRNEHNSFYVRKIQPSHKRA